MSVTGGNDTSGGDDDGTQWNGLWYATSDDYDGSDGYDHNCTSDDDSEGETDDSYIGGLPQDCTHGTPDRMSTPISKGRSLYSRACNGIASICVSAQPADNVVRAAS